MFDGLSTGEAGALITSVGFAVLVLMSLLPRLRSVGWIGSVKMALGWIVIFGGLIFLASQWQTIRSAVDPASPVSNANEVRVAARDDGHFYVRAAVNGDTVLFLVDTGATDIVLTQATAERLGYDDLLYDGVAQTANGEVRIAGVVLDRIEVGPVVLDDVPASVNAGALNENLLGMRFLNALRGWRVENGELILSI